MRSESLTAKSAPPLAPGVHCAKPSPSGYIRRTNSLQPFWSGLLPGLGLIVRVLQTTLGCGGLTGLLYGLNKPSPNPTPLACTPKSILPSNNHQHELLPLETAVIPDQNSRHLSLFHLTKNAGSYTFLDRLYKWQTKSNKQLLCANPLK